jgi:[NiFe] hydrogenase diaphorase moiety large subunit
MDTLVQQIIERYGKDRYRLMDMLLDIQDARGFITEEAIKQTALSTNLSRADVLQTISFYHFFRTEPSGKFTVYLNNSAVALMKGQARVKAAFEKETGCKFGQVSPDGVMGLYETSCIGMNDQEPAAIINGKVFTNLTPFKVRELVRDMRQGRSIEELMTGSFGEGANSLKVMRSMVRNNIYRRGIVLEDPYIKGEGLKAAVLIKPEEVINEIKESDIRGRGGAGFPTGMKWEFCRRAQGDRKFIFCNADEGEPGTFKDRVILTERPCLLFEGMAIAGYAVGASEGILYLRYEYRYLKEYLEAVLDECREAGYLGQNILGKEGFNFDIRIQFGGGAYVCGEESALIESAEGKRGEPRDRPPFPVEKGYLECPTVVNNVETLCSAVKIVVHGGEWYAGFGTKDSTGTKVLSVSGDCQFPGIYEVEWGIRINDILEMVGAYDVQALQVGGPSGALIGPKEFGRALCYADLATGGSIIVIGPGRDIIRDVVLNFTDFFIEESCGSCSTCRVVPVVLRDKIEKILNGHGVNSDLDDITNWGKILKVSRCGLGHTAANPILSSMKNFRNLYESYIQHGVSFDSGFDLAASVQESCKVVGRVPNLNHH